MKIEHGYFYILCRSVLSHTHTQTLDTLLSVWQLERQRIHRETPESYQGYEVRAQLAAYYMQVLMRKGGRKACLYASNTHA